MCTREGETTVEVTRSASYSDEEEEEEVDEEKIVGSRPGRKSLH